MNRKLKMDELGRPSLEEFRSQEKTPLLVVLDNIRSHHNVGSVFRTADAFGLEGIILCGFTPTPPHRDIHKTALGSTDSVNWSYSSTTVEAVKTLKASGVRVLAVEQTENSISLERLNLNKGEKLALVMGNEVGGVDQEVIDSCDGVVEIPQVGTKHSINVSVCAGILMWELFRKFHFQES